VYQFARSLRNSGGPGTRIAEIFRDALRGDQDPVLLKAFPTLATFSHEIAARVNTTPTFLVTSAIALDQAMTSGDIESSLDDNRGLCISAVFERLEA